MHLKWFAPVRDCEIVAACDAEPGRAAAFAREHNVPLHYESLKELLKNPTIDGILNATSDRGHAPVSLAAIKAGKHVLCEKPLALNHSEARRMTQAAERAGVVNMVNFTYRNAPAIHAAKRLVDSGRLGEIMHIDASYLQSWLASRVWGDWRKRPSMLWKLSKKHGGTGVLGDVGIHILDFATLPVGKIKSVRAHLKAFSSVKGDKHGEYDLDANDTALIHAEFANGAIGTIQASRWATGYLNTLQLRIFGSRGGVRLDLDKSWNEIEVCHGRNIHTGKWHTVKCPPQPTIYENFVRAIRTGRAEEPTFRRGTEVQEVLDACFLSEENRKTIAL